jgi:hypothetical protein
MCEKMIPYVHCPGSIQAGSRLAISHGGPTCHDIRTHNTQCLYRYEKSTPLADAVCESHEAGRFPLILLFGDF